MDTLIKEYLPLIARGLLVLEGERHKDYDRVCAVAKQARMLSTGVDIDTLLEMAVNEDEEMLAERKRITIDIIKPVWANLMSDFHKISTSNAIKRSITYDNDNKSKEALDFALDHFWGKDSLFTYMDTKYMEDNESDPNKFHLVEFKDFDNNTGRLQPYPFEVPSEQAWDYTYTNRILDYLMVANEISVLPNSFSEGIERDGTKLTIYLKGQVFDLVEQHQRYSIQGIHETVDGWFITGKFQTYKIVFHDPNRSTFVQGGRIGFKRDKVTNGNTYVTPLDNAIPFLLKTIKVNSELDIVANKLAHPERSQFGLPCKDTSCLNGVHNVTNEVCSTCHGQSFTIPAPSSQVTNIVPLPDDKSSYIPLKDHVAYAHPPVAIIEWQENYIDKLVEKAKAFLHNSDQTRSQQTNETATKVVIDDQNIYNSLYPAAVKKAQFEEYLIRVIAQITELDKGLIVEVNVDKDFKLKTVTNLMIDLEAANRSGAGESVTSKIKEDIIEIMHAGDPNKIRRYKDKMRLIPFIGKSEKEIILIRSSNHVRLIDKVKFDYADVILRKLELEFDNFYDLTIENKMDLVEDKARLILDEINNETASTVIEIE